MEWKKEDGAIIVEATISLTTFIFMIIMILSVINICYVQEKISIALHETAKEISVYSYLYGLTGWNEERAKLAAGGAEAKNTLDETISGMTAITDSVAGLKDNIGETIQSDSAEAVYRNLNILVTNYQTQTADITSSAAVIQEQIEGIAKDPKAFIIGSFKCLATTGINEASSRLIAAPIAKIVVKEHLRDRPDGDCEVFLKKMGLVPKNGSYLKGIDFSNSVLFDPKYVKKGETATAEPSNEIRIVAVYKVKVLRFLPVDITLNFCQSAVTKGWFGVKETAS